MKLKDLGEFGLIEQIRQRAPVGPGVHRGIGDDAAETSLPEGHHLLTSTDLLIEETHFRHDWTSCEDLGHKAVAVNLSDIAAMGGIPRYLYLGLACPGETELDDINAFLKGALDEAKDHNVILVGGDTCRSPGPWMISVTIEGSAPAHQAVGRDGAQPGDLIMVSGTVGDSALALHLLRDGVEPEAVLLARHHRPTAQVELGRLLGDNRLARAMIDISDGLAGDLDHILQASGVDGLLEENQLPLSKIFRQHTDKDPGLKKLALYGGEDYELLFTVAPEKAVEVATLSVELNLPITSIGVILKGSGTLSLQDKTGDVRPILVRGYDHFCRL
ncbi:MAG: thiamine-phosphate kinase [Desulfuromonadales bacterium]|nr:thiamine-phosphate kinase [Desulfuromonadales bacterium]